MCGCAAFLGLYATQGILPQIAATFGTRIEQAALGITATTVAMAATAPFVGMLTRRLERRRIITLAALLLAAPMLWTAHADSFAEFLAGRIATGVVIPVLFAVTVSYIGETWQDSTATEMPSFFIAGTTLGGFGGRFIVNGVTGMSGWPRALDVLACAMLAAGVATNSGTGVISQGSVSAGYQLPSGTTTLAYNAASKTLSGFPVGTTVTIAGTPPTSINITSATTPVPYDPSKGASMTISSTTQPAPSGVMNGVSVSLSGTPADGDQFTIGANKGTNDGRNALALSQLVNSKTMNNGTTTLTGAYAGYVNAIGNAASQLTASSAAQTALVGQITQAQQSVSGVNQNEEAANLMQYQQLYQANAKVIQTANSVFQTVLGLFN